MDDNFENNKHNTDNNNNDTNNITDIQQNNEKINNYSLDNNGKIRASGRDTAAATRTNTKTFTILGWISAGLAAFISPFFAIAGVLFGSLVNRQEKGRGNAIIITNIVLAAINIVFGLILMVLWRRMMMGY